MARLVRLGVWVLVVAGPVLGAAAWVSASGARAAVEPPAASAPVGVLAAATQMVAGYVSADDPSDLADVLGSASQLRVDPVGATPASVTPAASEPNGAGWLVTVAVITTDGLAGWYAVDVTARPGGGWSIVGPPGRVGDPTEVELAPKTLPVPDPADARLAASEAWLRAWLTGDGSDAERFASPTLHVAPVNAPFDSVTLTGFDVTGPASSPTVSIALLADGDGGSEPLTYRLRLVGRDGRWEVAELFPTKSSIPQGELS